MNAADQLANQTDWHTDVKTITSLFYAGGFIYYTKSGTNALYRRGFEIESDVVGQQRFSTTTSGHQLGHREGCVRREREAVLHRHERAAALQRPGTRRRTLRPQAPRCRSRTSGWKTRTLFPYQGTPAPVNDAPVAKITGASCTELACSFKGSTSSDWDGDPLTYSWDFGDATDAVTTADASHTYATAGCPDGDADGQRREGSHGHRHGDREPGRENMAPTATITDAELHALDCSFKGETSSDPDGDTLTYSWDFGDTSALVTTENASRTYATGGSKTVTLTVSDGNGGSDTDTVTVSPVAPPVNVAPTATITDATCTELACSFKGRPRVTRTATR